LPSGGSVLGPRLQSLAEELAEIYVRGDLVLVAGAGVSRASGLPGWSEMVAVMQSQAAADLAARIRADDLDLVLTQLHGADPISRADSLQRLLGTPLFRTRLQSALYGGLPTGVSFRPSISHWHLASLVDRTRMPDVFTSNFDDLLEDAKIELGRSGRVRHFHGRLPQKWAGVTRLGDPPVVTSRDYFAAESQRRYERLATALSNKTVVLVGFSLSDPNLARIIQDKALDCRAVVVASPAKLTPAQQKIRLGLLRRYWLGLNISVDAIEAHEELPAFLLTLRRRILEKQGQSMTTLGVRALREGSKFDPWACAGAREWRAALRDAVAAAKAIGEGVRGDRSLRAGFYALEATGELVHLISSQSTQRSYARWPRRRLNAGEARPWGAAGYCYAAGVPISSSATGAAFDRNVPEDQLLAWQTQRASQNRLPASSVLCVPAWVKFRRRLMSIGVLYFSSQRGAAFDAPADGEKLQEVLRLTLKAMIRDENVVEGGLA
jgi:NAD-dependent SIR2 family protein deacetylase